MQDYSSMNKKELEKLYLDAKAYYYEGREIMSDLEFDTLELEIKDRYPKSTVLSVVGYSSKRFEFKHKEKMLSLGKIQINEELDSEYQELIKWCDRAINSKKFIIQPKYDGNALSALYEEGKLVRVLTRGNGESGFDVTEKVNIPKEITIKDSVEIRGECLIDIKDFEKINKNSEFKNERNFVAGVLSNTKSAQYIEYLHFVAFQITNIKSDYGKVLDLLKNNSFEISDFWIKDLYSMQNVKKVYKEMKEYREKSPYRLDGYVVKIDNFELREKLGFNSHHPLSEVAIKFPADLSKTKIKDIEWTMSSQRELVPTAILEPVLLDGSMVSRAYLANFKNIISNSYFPGSIVAVQKKGDIIPQITKLISMANYTKDDIENLKPKFCPFCSSALEYDEDFTHILCSNDNCSEFMIKRLYKSVQILGIKNLGPSTVKRLYNSGISHVRDLFNKNLKNILSESDEFKEGRELERILESILAIRTVNYEDILRIEQVSGVGTSLSKALAEYYLNIDDNFSGFDKKLVEYMKENKELYFDNLLDSWKKYIEVILPVKEDNSDITFAILTGSPKSAGYPTKKYFLDRFTNIRETKSFKEADVLITNDLDSNSSKMKKAKTSGLKILRYEDFN